MAHHRFRPPPPPPSTFTSDELQSQINSGASRDFSGKFEKVFPCSRKRRLPGSLKAEQAASSSYPLWLLLPPLWATALFIVFFGVVQLLAKDVTTITSNEPICISHGRTLLDEELCTLGEGTFLDELDDSWFTGQWSNLLIPEKKKAVNGYRTPQVTRWNGFRWVSANELQPAGHQASHPLGNPFDRGFGGSVVGSGERKHRIFGADEIDLMFVSQIVIFALPLYLWFLLLNGSLMALFDEKPFGYWTSLKSKLIFPPGYSERQTSSSVNFSSWTALQKSFRTAAFRKRSKSGVDAEKEEQQSVEMQDLQQKMKSKNGESGAQAEAEAEPELEPCIRTLLKVANGKGHFTWKVLLVKLAQLATIPFMITFWSDFLSEQPGLENFAVFPLYGARAVAYYWTLAFWSPETSGGSLHFPYHYPGDVFFPVKFKCRRQIVGASGSPNIVTSVCLQPSNYFLERLVLALWLLMAVTFACQLISFLVTLLRLVIPALGRRYLLGASKYKEYFDDEDDEDEKVENEVWSEAIKAGCVQNSFPPYFHLVTFVPLMISILGKTATARLLKHLLYECSKEKAKNVMTLVAAETDD